MSTLLNPKAGDVYRDTLTDTVFRIDWVSRGQVYYCKAKARGDRQYTEGMLCRIDLAAFQVLGGARLRQTSGNSPVTP